jgi:hypothetical protein
MFNIKDSGNNAKTYTKYGILDDLQNEGVLCPLCVIYLRQKL